MALAWSMPARWAFFVASAWAWAVAAMEAIRASRTSLLHGITAAAQLATQAWTYSAAASTRET